MRHFYLPLPALFFLSLNSIHPDIRCSNFETKKNENKTSPDRLLLNRFDSVRHLGANRLERFRI